MERILQIGFSDNPGGVENVVMNYYRVINKSEFQFDFLDMYGKGIAYKEQIEELGGKIYTTINYKKHPVKAYRQIRKILIENNFKCMHVHMQSAANLLPIIAGLKENIKVIAHSHSSSTPKGIARKVFHNLNLMVLRKLKIEKYACGKKAGEWLWKDKFKYDHVILNATDLLRFRYDVERRRIIRERIGFQNNFVIGFVGRFGQEKNTFFLIDILKKMLEIDNSVRLLTVGGNDLYDEFESEIRKKNLDRFYYSAGIQKDSSDWYQAMDAFLMPSFFEGFPMVGIEAQAAGLPCYFSNRISDEINVTGNIIFLPITEKESDSCWASKILEHRKSERLDINNTEIVKYEVSNAVLGLEKIYKNV